MQSKISLGQPTQYVNKHVSWLTAFMNTNSDEFYTLRSYEKYMSNIK